MPNWCGNNLTISHDDPAMIQKFCDAYNSGETMQAFLPCPQELRDTMSGSYGKGTPEQKALEKQQAANVKKHGHPTWYEWNIANWGTKWDFGRGKDDDKIEPSDANTVRDLNFQTAWSPPIEFFDHLCRLGYRVRVLYCEPGCGFCGIYENGDDDTIQLDSSLDDVPDEIVDCFGLEEVES